MQPTVYFVDDDAAVRDAISLLLSLARQIPDADASTRAGKWEKNRFMGVEVTNKVLGIIGAGNIGSIVADRALGLKMKVIAFDPFLTPERAVDLGVEKVELEQLLATLKLQVGQTTEAKVAQIVLLSDAEKLQLIAARETDKPNAGQQTLLSMLRSPNLNLVTLIVRDHSVTSLTNLPLTQNSQIQILVTPQGLRLLPPATPITQLPAQAAELALPQSLTPTMKAPKPLAAAITSPTRVGELPIGSLSAPNRVLPQTAAAAPKALLAAATSQAAPRGPRSACAWPTPRPARRPTPVQSCAPATRVR